MDIQRHCKLIQNHKSAERLEDWQQLVVAVTDLIDTGLPPSNPDLRKHLLPVIDDLSEIVELSPNFYLVLRELDRFLAKRLPSTGKKGAKSAGMAPIAEVQRVRSFLRGRVLLLIGGERRPNAIAALTQAFDLKELIGLRAMRKPILTLNRMWREKMWPLSFLPSAGYRTAMAK